MTDMSTLFTDGVVADVTRETFSVMLGCELFEASPDDAPAHGATSLVHITGVAECTVQLTFTEKLSTRLAAAMFDMDESEVDELSLADALGELANVVGGGVKALLPAPSQLSLPVVTLNSDATILPTAASADAITFSDGSEHLTVTVWRSSPA